ncbi:ShlB/FhaC/HecB family hemolysin secretion/activation protein [Hephaestia mangrovi]|uniref:ShlB/FhaC/HecB family hemolysin secretion/activation protein n=1 Tax=Hephaestia mangrovi TaxID=2873268 RepID=UPI001CA64372|nr:ShlB/FhaC/HecB family hemolysin secretion/activation protein [Hephaestia mangrovi]MBY8828903.1 hypothetical protein [Hephaestia mangrovi]
MTNVDGRPRASARRVVVRSSFGILLLAVPAALHAQTASQITPPSYAPPVERRPEAPLALPSDIIRQAPPGSESLFVTLGDLTVSGGTLAPQTMAMLRSRLIGKRISVAQVFAAAQDAEAAEARAGRVLVRVVVPQQDIADGKTLRLMVVEGFVESVDLSGVPKAVRARIAGLLAGLQDRRDVELAQLERKLTLAADTPGVTLRSALKPGKQPGGVVLQVAADWRPITGLVSFDNSLPSALGHDSFGIGVNLNSVLGAGELIYLRAYGLPNGGGGTGFLDATPRDRTLAAGAILPLGHDGLTLTVEGTDARTAPRHSDLLPGFASHFQRLSYTLRYPVVRRRALTVGVEGRFDVEDDRVRIISPIVLPVSKDKLRVARAAADVSAWLPAGGLASARIELSLGINGLGARSAADATPIDPLSRAGTDADFRKLLFTGSISQPVAPHVEVTLQGQAQSSLGKPLANAEQIGIAVADGISTLPSGALQGDDGYVVRGDLRAPFSLPAKTVFARLTPYVFAAQGGVHYQQPTVLERATTHAFAYGTGLRFDGQASDGGPGLSARLEYGSGHVEGRRDDRVSITLFASF